MKENKKCPSYDNGTCESAPMPYSVKCSDMKDCVWHNKAKFEESYKRIFKGGKMSDDIRELKENKQVIDKLIIELLSYSVELERQIIAHTEAEKKIKGAK